MKVGFYKQNFINEKTFYSSPDSVRNVIDLLNKIFSILLNLLCGNPIGRLIDTVEVIISSSSLKPVGISGSKDTWLLFSTQPLATQHCL